MVMQAPAAVRHSTGAHPTSRCAGQLAPVVVAARVQHLGRGCLCAHRLCARARAAADHVRL